MGLCLAFAFGAAIGIFNAANLSGGHLNPAVTVALCITDRCKWKNIPFYWIGQFIGAFAAAALVYGTYSDGILHLDPELRYIQIACLTSDWLTPICEILGMS